MSYLKKFKKNWSLHTRLLHSHYKSRSKQNKKNPTHALIDITKQKTCAKFQQKILSPMVVGAGESFKFFRQKNWFLGNNRGLP